MSSIKLESNASGTGIFTIASPNSNTNRTLTLPDNTGTILTAASTPAFASTIGVGGATAAASGAGITFPATASASSDVNTLDDYEEGTWTPIIGGSSGQSGQSYTLQVGTYVKVGKIVVASFRATLSNKGTISGTYVQIKGLPFTIQTAEIQSGSPLYFVSLATNWITLNLQTEENSTNAYVWGMTAAGVSRTYPAASDIGNSTQLAGILVYQST